MQTAVDIRDTLQEIVDCDCGGEHSMRVDRAEAVWLLGVINEKLPPQHRRERTITLKPEDFGRVI